MDISVSNTNSTRRSGMDMPVSCFDGYDAPSTKDAEHSRRVASSREVLIEDNIHVSMSQQEFLGEYCEQSALHCPTHIASGSCWF